jgi:hypothetical protein
VAKREKPGVQGVVGVSTGERCSCISPLLFRRTGLLNRLKVSSGFVGQLSKFQPVDVAVFSVVEIKSGDI